MNITESSAATTVLRHLAGATLPPDVEDAAQQLAERAAKALQVTAGHVRAVPRDTTPQADPKTPLICPVCGADGAFLVETGYTRSWATSTDGASTIIGTYGGSEDWSSEGAGDDHLECDNGHAWDAPAGWTVEYR